MEKNPSPTRIEHKEAVTEPPPAVPNQLIKGGNEEQVAEKLLTDWLSGTATGEIELMDCFQLPCVAALSFDSEERRDVDLIVEQFRNARVPFEVRHTDIDGIEVDRVMVYTVAAHRPEDAGEFLERFQILSEATSHTLGERWSIPADVERPMTTNVR